MWAAVLSRASLVVWITLPMLASCGVCWRIADRQRGFPTTHIPRFFPTPFVGYSADNSWRAISTRSLNVRSRIICRSTLSTLWITVE
jgi:hypothetical protein